MAKATIYNKDYVWVELAPYKEFDKIVCFSVEWPSYWHDAIIHLLLTATKRGRKWHALSLAIPKQTPVEDFVEIDKVKWYIADKKTSAKYPPIMMAWGYDDPPVYILACSDVNGSKKVPINAQLNQMLSEKQPDPAKHSITNAIRRLGPGTCTVISSFGPFEFQISKSGLFHSPKNLPPITILPDKILPSEMSTHIASYLTALTMLTSTLILVVTTTDETVCVRNGKDSIIPVNVKELHGFSTEVATDVNGDQCISWRKLTPDETKKLYELDKETNQAFEMVIKEREYRFV